MKRPFAYKINKKQIKYTLLLVAAILLFSSLDKGHSIQAHPFDVKQTKAILFSDVQSDLGPIKVMIDSGNLPLFFYQDVFTGVCLDKQCKPVNIILYWDASGTFLGFYSPKDERLTKVDHVAFSDYDYFVFYTILNNPFSILGKLSYEDLTGGSNSVQEVDANSGATTIVDKNAVVQGAAYTCYTLWHIVNDTLLTNAIRRFSIEKINERGLAENEVVLIDNHIHPALLAIYLFDADKRKKLRKLKYQRLITDNLDEVDELNSLIINNYLDRQVYVFPKIEKRLNVQVDMDVIFNRMIGQ